MVRSILPKLAWALSDALVINPADQDLTAWQWVTAWAPVMPVLPLLALLEAHFFPKWHDVLRAWLSHGPDYEEISNWYVNWKVSAPACQPWTDARSSHSDEGYRFDAARSCTAICERREQNSRSGHVGDACAGSAASQGVRAREGAGTAGSGPQPD